MMNRSKIEGLALACSVPEPAPPTEAAIYRSFRETMIRAHCARKGEAHQCAGEITITRGAITFRCRLCGDYRQTIEGGAWR